jgi:glycosyltransferase involved in cell wall biosynthesis
MKIGILISDLNIKGGAQREVLELAKALQENNSVIVYTYNSCPENCYSKIMSSLDIVSVENNCNGKKNDGNLLKEFMLRFFNIFYMRRYCKKILGKISEDIDIFNIHTFSYPIVTEIKSHFKAPIVAMINDVPIPPTIKNFSIKNLFLLGLGYVDFFLYKNEIKKIDRIVVLDKGSKETLMKYYGKEAIIVRSGLDCNEFAFIDRKKNKKLKILSTSIFFPYRRIEDTINALKILKDNNKSFEYHHIGSDRLNPDYAKKIYKLVEENGLGGYVKFHGVINEEGLLKFYQESDVFVFPNSPQTWGLAVFEAMSCGTPVICSTGAGAHEVLENGKNSLIVSDKSPKEIASKIIQLDENEELWNKLHHEGRIFVENNISWKKYKDEMLDIFKKTIHNYY